MDFGNHGSKPAREGTVPATSTGLRMPIMGVGGRSSFVTFLYHEAFSRLGKPQRAFLSLRMLYKVFSENQKSFSFLSIVGILRFTEAICRCVLPLRTSENPLVPTPIRFEDGWAWPKSAGFSICGDSRNWTPSDNKGHLYRVQDCNQELYFSEISKWDVVSMYGMYIRIYKPFGRKICHIDYCHLEYWIKTLFKILCIKTVDRYW